jgi:hypothetical protein
MKKLVYLLMLSMLCSSQAEEIKDPVGQNITWIFLNTGPGRGKTKEMSQETLGKMQSDHVGNFGVQFNRGTVMAAGPLGDNGFIRGTVILAVQSPEQIAECFKPDPFVQNEILAVESHPWLVNLRKFGSPKVPFQLARYTLCVVKKGEHWDSSSSAVTPDSILRLFPVTETGALKREVAISGPFTDLSDKLGLLLFNSTNQTQIQAQLEKEPMVAERRVQIELHPQFMGQGTFLVPGEDTEPPKPGKSTRLFDGESFTGWEGDTQKTWHIVERSLVGGSLRETVPHNEFLCTTRSYTNFDLRLKVKLTGTGFVNGGIQFRSRRLTDPAFEMSGYQADMGEGYWGSLYDESRRNKTMALSQAILIPHILKANDWNDYVIRCEGPHIRLWLNGVLTVDYTETEQQIPLSGLIGVQIHGGGKAEAAYKEISIAGLP